MRWPRTLPTCSSSGAWRCQWRRRTGRATHTQSEALALPRAPLLVIAVAAACGGALLPLRAGRNAASTGASHGPWWVTANVGHQHWLRWDSLQRSGPIVEASAAARPALTRLRIPRWRPHAPPACPPACLPRLLAWRRLLRELAVSNPPAFLCHYYNHYFAHTGARLVSLGVPVLLAVQHVRVRVCCQCVFLFCLL